MKAEAEEERGERKRSGLTQSNQKQVAVFVKHERTPARVCVCY